MSTFMIGLVLATLCGHICIMVITKMLHVLYMRNIEDAFAEKKLEVKLQKRVINDTQKSEAVPMIENEYKNNQNYDSKNSLNKWEVTSKSSSSNKLDTARNLLTSNSRPASASQRSNKIVPVLSESDVEEFHQQKSYIGDTEVLTDESKRVNSVWNTTIFMVLLGFIAFLTLF